MRSFATDGSNDLFISGRELAFANDLQAILNIAKHAAQAILGEMVLARDEGMPYFQTIWVGNPNAAAFEVAFRRRVGAIDGVREIASLDTRQVGEEMRYVAEIVTIYGTGTLNG